MKNIYGIKSKLGTLIEKSKDTLLYTAERADGEKVVYVVIDGFVAVRCLLGVYRSALQTHTRTDAPEVRQGKDTTGSRRVASGVADCVEDMMEKANKTAYDTGFTAVGSNGKGTIRIFASEDGAPVLLNSKYVDAFDTSEAQLSCGRSIDPLIIHLPFEIDALIMPIRVDGGRAAAFTAISENAANRRR